MTRCVTAVLATPASQSCHIGNWHFTKHHEIPDSASRRCLSFTLRLRESFSIVLVRRWQQTRLSTRTYETSETRKAQYFIERKACDSQRHDVRHTRRSRVYKRINRKTHTPLFVFVAFIPLELRVFGKWTRRPRARYLLKVRPDSRSLSLASTKKRHRLRSKSVQ